MSVTNFYNYEGVENDFTPVTEKDIIESMFQVFKDYTESNKFTETKRYAKEMVKNIEDTYQEIINLSHESSLNNDNVHKTSEIMQFIIENDRTMNLDELKTKDEYIIKADELIAQKMVPLMDSLNKIFEEYKMNCRFIDLDDFATVRYQAQEIELARLEGPVSAKQLMSQHSMQSFEERKLAHSGQDAVNIAEGKFDRFAENRGYNDYGTIQSQLEEECKKNDIELEQYKNPNFAKDDSETVYSC